MLKFLSTPLHAYILSLIFTISPSQYRKIRSYMGKLEKFLAREREQVLSSLINKPSCAQQTVPEISFILIRHLNFELTNTHNTEWNCYP